MSEQAETPKRQELECPHCSTKIPFGLVAKFADKSRFAFKMTPAPGELMQAATIGGALTNMQKLLEATGKHVGIPTIVLVEKIEDDGAGGFTITMLSMRGEEAVRQKKRRRGKPPVKP